MKRILVCEDEEAIRDFVVINLRRAGYDVVDVACGEDAVEVYNKQGGNFDVALLDIMMPGMDGFSLCRWIREQSSEIGIIMLSAKSQEMDKVNCLMIGADDYVTKPFNPLELAARVKAQLRRYKSYNAEPLANVFEYDGLSINRDTHTCRLFEREITLTPTEFNILWLLCENAGSVVSSEQIFERVWGEDYLDSNNTVMVHIRRIRDKLGEKPRSPHYIKTVWGVGYKVEKSDIK